MAENPSQQSLIELSKLRWHCRRGVKELDVVLRNYLDNHYLDSTNEYKEAFKELLQLEDPILMSLVMDYDSPDDKHQKAVLNKIKTPF